MKERPILFSAPMVRALIDGSKTQTRRVCKPAESAELDYVVGIQDPRDFGQRPLEVLGSGWFGDEEGDVQFCSPYGHPDDRLWVRETFFAFGRWETRYSEKKQRDEWHFIDMTLACDRAYQYAADNPDVPLAKGRGVTPGWWTRPAIFMPRHACRTVLEIVSVRVERLQDISEADCWAEGIDACDGLLDDMKIFEAAKRMGRTFEDAAPTYAALWESINGAGSWDANPWVWVIEFRRVQA
jgi:hypothetical protein